MRVFVLQGGLGNVLIQANYYITNFDKSNRFSYFIGGSAKRKNTLRDELTQKNFIFMPKLIYKFSRLVSMIIPGIKLYDGYYLESLDLLCEKFDFFNLIPSSTEVQNRAVIHVRGGDYLDENNFIYNVADSLYYENAILYIRSQGINEFFVVTDDIPFARSLLSNLGCKLGINFNFREQDNEINDFLFLATSKYMIISNSTFSLTASIFQQHLKVVVAPKNWSRDNSINPKLPKCIIKI